MYDAPENEPDGLQKLIDQLQTDIHDDGTSHTRYTDKVEQLAKLYKIKADNRPTSVDPNTLLSVAGSLLGILLIVGYEKKNIMTSKALGFAIKLK